MQNDRTLSAALAEKFHLKGIQPGIVSYLLPTGRLLVIDYRTATVAEAEKVLAAGFTQHLERKAAPKSEDKPAKAGK